MDTPKITLVDGTEVFMPRPTMKMWRRVAEYDETEKADWSIARLMDEHSKIIADMFDLDSPDVIDPADVLPVYLEAARYVIGIASEKLKALPKNGQGVEAEK